MNNSNIYKLNIKDVAGAIVSAILVSVIGYIMTVGDIYALDLRTLTNTAVMTALASLLKSLATDNSGKLLGKVQIK